MYSATLKKIQAYSAEYKTLQAAKATVLKYGMSYVKGCCSGSRERLGIHPALKLIVHCCAKLPFLHDDTTAQLWKTKLCYPAKTLSLTYQAPAKLHNRNIVHIMSGCL